jgi:hypothetical protein
MSTIFAAPFLAHGQAIAPAAAVERLREAAAALPLSAILLASGLPESVEQACAEEAQRLGSALFLRYVLNAAEEPQPGPLAAVVNRGLYDGIFLEGLREGQPELSPSLEISALFGVTGDEAIDAVFRARTHRLLDRLEAASAIVRGAGLELGLDCVSPSLARLFGQDLSFFDYHCDWISVRLSALPGELCSLAEALLTQGVEEEQALDRIAHAAGMPLPPTLAALRTEGVAPEILWLEAQRAREAGVTNLVAGLDLSRDRTEEHIRGDYRALQTALPNGFLLLPDVGEIQTERLTLLHSLRRRSHPL